MKTILLSNIKKEGIKNLLRKYIDILPEVEIEVSFLEVEECSIKIVFLKDKVGRPIFFNHKDDRDIYDLLVEEFFSNELEFSEYLGVKYCSKFIIVDK